MYFSTSTKKKEMVTLNYYINSIIQFKNNVKNLTIT